MGVRGGRVTFQTCVMANDDASSDFVVDYCLVVLADNAGIEFFSSINGSE